MDQRAVPRVLERFETYRRVALSRTTKAVLTPSRGSVDIALRGVSKTYRSGAQAVAALADVDLDIPPGSFAAIVGRSGSGKSTLLHLLAGMDVPTAGEIEVGTWALATLDRHAQARYRREMVGMIFQQFNLVPTMTALDNVALPLILAGEQPGVRAERARTCLAMVGLAHRSGHRPGELSGGEQQRVAIARALVADPPILLADEPTGNLDSATAAQIVDVLARVNRDEGRTVVVVTHHLSEVEQATTLHIELADGRRVR